MMTFEKLAKTFEILASHRPDEFVMDWAEHDEWGIDLRRFDLSPEEIRTLAEIGWGLGSDSEYDEDEMEAWFHPEDHTDSELVELYNMYKSIYKIA